ncbi:NAD(P)H-dependent oxidoreductase, partial [Methanoregula sp.]|uniref:NAD(P)H-dependent oxidoreductase n=1 Tax=Methanoregula sp. TaxID=2052170 RepID=UPI000CC179D4
TYIKKKFPKHTYEQFNVAQDIRKIEKDTAAWNAILDSVRSADLVLFAFPLYYLVVSSQYKRFIELIFERNAQDVFAGTYAASISTSIHFFDQIAHAYIHAISDDLGMKYLGFYSAAMDDLLQEEEQKRLQQFASLLITAVQEKIPVQQENAPLAWPQLAYSPGAPARTLDTKTKKIVILTDEDGSSPNLSAMTARLAKTFSGSVETINLHDVNIKGGCLGCCQCGYDNTCVYTDGYTDFFTNTLVPADIIVIAGSVHDRYLSSTWKQFFDRSFFKGHIPGLKGKQIGFVIAGPLHQIPCLKEALVAWADNGGCHAHFVTDEVSDSGELDALRDTMAQRLHECAEISYIPPRTFYAVGGHKIFRDSVYGEMRFIFQADYRYYCRNGLLDFPQADLKTRFLKALFIPLTKISGFRKNVYGGMKYHMIKQFEPVLKNAA